MKGISRMIKCKVRVLFSMGLRDLLMKENGLLISSMDLVFFTTKILWI